MTDGDGDGDDDPDQDDDARELEARGEPTETTTSNRGRAATACDATTDPGARTPRSATQRSASAVSTDLAGPYRPTRRMATRIKTRDRRCRFPGCTISTVFCDIDHVRPWPHGPTHDTNLVSLCRRHHRIKQRLRWTVALTPDGIATWTDPTGRVRTTHPANALHTSVLPAVDPRTHSTPHSSTDQHQPGPHPCSPTDPTAPWSSTSNTTAHPHQATPPPP